MRNILVATDFSASSRYALRIALKNLLLNNKFNSDASENKDKDQLTLITVIRPPSEENRGAKYEHTFDEAHEEQLAIQRMKEALKYEMDKLKDSSGNLINLNIQTEFRVEIGRDIASKLTEVANTIKASDSEYQQYKYEIIVVGSHGQASHQRKDIGSVSDFLLKNSHIPVLLVKDAQLIKKL